VAISAAALTASCGDDFTSAAGGTSSAGGATSQAGAGGVANGGSAGSGGQATGGEGGESCVVGSDPCSQCEDDKCHDLLCNCNNNPACRPLETCLRGCGTTAGCDQGCMTADKDGISDLLLLMHCGAEQCSSDCSSLSKPPSECNLCLLNDCPGQFNSCYAEASCVAIIECVRNCTDDACQMDCKSKDLTGKSLYEALMACATVQCPLVCN